VAAGMRARVVVAGAVLVVAAAACNPGDQDQPDAIDRRDVPFELLDTTSTTRSEPVSPAAQTITLYFVAGDRLVPIARTLEGPVDAALLLQDLLEGPTTEEATIGVETAIPTRTRIRGVSQSGRTLTIRLSSDLAQIGDDATQAIGQLVLTATTVPGVDRVRFVVDGTPVQVPTGDGTLADRAVGPDDYRSLLE
jgi:spore germination protein GerM